MSIRSAVQSPLRAEFPDRPLRPVPDPYNGAIEADDLFSCRNACDICECGIDYDEDMAVTRTLYGEIEVLCPRCFVAKYDRSMSNVSFRLEKALAYVNVYSEGKFYRWEAPL
jgi:hypothetical protein